MVVQLNPAISSKRAVVPMKKNNQNSAIKTNHSEVSFEGKGAVIVGGILLTIATLFACNKDPGVKPDKPSADTTIVKPPVNPVNEKAVVPYLNPYTYNVHGVDTVAYPAKNIASFATNIQPTGKDPYKQTYTFNKELSSGEDTIVMDLVKNDTLMNGRYKFFVEKDPISGAKNLASQNWSLVNGKLVHSTDSRYRKTANSFINESRAVISSVVGATSEYTTNGKGNVEIKVGTSLVAKVTNLFTKLKNLKRIK